MFNLDRFVHIPPSCLLVLPPYLWNLFVLIYLWMAHSPWHTYKIHCVDKTDFELKFFLLLLIGNCLPQQNVTSFGMAHTDNMTMSLGSFSNIWDLCGLLWQVPTNDMETTQRQHVRALCYLLQYALFSVLHEYDVAWNWILAGRAKVIGVSRISEPYDVGSFRQSALLPPLQKCDKLLFSTFCMEMNTGWQSKSDGCISAIRPLCRLLSSKPYVASFDRCQTVMSSCQPWYAIAHITKDNFGLETSLWIYKKRGAKLYLSFLPI